jgi:hypothetical protein
MPSNVRLCGLVLLLAAGPAAADDTPYDLTPAKGLDERLFLVRLIETTYAQMPTAAADPAVVRNWIKGNRLRLTRVRAHARAEDVSPKLVGLLDEALDLIDKYESFLRAVGAIHAADGGLKDFGSIGLDAVGRGYGVSQFALTNPLGVASAPYALGAGAVVAVGSGVYDLYRRYNQGAEVAEAKKRLLDDEASAVNGKFEAAYASAETMARKLAEQHNWGAAAGFDDSIRKPGAEQLALRPNDPFAAVSAAEVDTDDADRHLANARRCLAAARKVPADRVYTPYRAEFVAAAARHAVAACQRQLRVPGQPGLYAVSRGPAAAADEAVRLCRTYLACAPDDPGGRGGYNLALALSCGGRHQQAVSAGWLVAKQFDDPGFANNFACILSMAGDTDDAMKWLTYSVGRGRQLGGIRSDPDLEAVRRERADAFADLVRVRFDWSIDWGIVGRDSIEVTNKSNFWLHDLALTVTVTSDTGPDWKETLTCDALAPGDTHTFVLPNPGITSRGSNYKAKASLACRENR